MRIKVVSDLHLEFSDIDIPNNESTDVLILSGDIMLANELRKFKDSGNSLNNYAVRFQKFLKRCSDNYPHVIYVAGNHEFYHGEFHTSINDLREECANYSNVHFLECDSVEIDDVLFVGGTLWTNLNNGDPLTIHAVQGFMNDYFIIRNDQSNIGKLMPDDTIDRHVKTLDYIKIVVDQNKDKKIVVVGHHTPSLKSCHPRYAHDHLINGAYHSDLSEVILDRPQIKLWTHGHTHNSFDYMIGETRVVCNPRGYHNGRYDEETGFDPSKIIEI